MTRLIPEEPCARRLRLQLFLEATQCVLDDREQLVAVPNEAFFAVSEQLRQHGRVGRTPLLASRTFFGIDQEYLQPIELRTCVHNSFDGGARALRRLRS